MHERAPRRVNLTIISTVHDGWTHLLSLKPVLMFLGIHVTGAEVLDGEEVEAIK